MNFFVNSDLTYCISLNKYTTKCLKYLKWAKVLKVGFNLGTLSTLNTLGTYTETLKLNYGSIS